jgi:Tfp pilus assembly protein FimV
VPALAIAAALPAFGVREEAEEFPPSPPLLVRVEYGDSLWTIAREHGDPSRDVRETVAAIRHANGVDPGRLRPGAMLLIPLEYADTGS